MMATADSLKEHLTALDFHYIDLRIKVATYESMSLFVANFFIVIENVKMSHLIQGATELSYTAIKSRPERIAAC